MQVETLATHLTAWEQDAPIDDVPGEAREDIHASLVGRIGRHPSAEEHG